MRKFLLIAGFAGCCAACSDSGSSVAPGRADAEQLPANGLLIFGRAELEAGSYEWRLFGAEGGTRPIKRLSPRTFVEPPSLSPDGRLVAFENRTPAARDPQVHVSGLRATASRQLTNFRTTTGGPGQWSPDGRRLLVYQYAAGGFQSVSVVDLKSGRNRFLRANGSGVAVATWAPDGRTLLAQTGPLGRPGLYRIDTRTGQATRIGDPVSAAFFGPPGRLTVITEGIRRGFVDLWIADEDMSSRELVVSTRGTFSRAVWSPDGSRLAVAVFFGDDDTFRLVVLDQGTRRATITRTNGVPGGNPLWSPDGTRIVFAPEHFRPHGLWVMDSDGANARQLTRTRKAELPLAWLPAE